jgi:hypothetical protein
MRIAMMLAAAGITGKFPARSAELLSHGLKSLGAADQLHDLTDQLRGEVLSAAKAAALTAATHRVDALNDRLQGVVPTEEIGRTAGSAVNGLTSATGLRRQRDDDFEDEDTYEDEEPLDVEEDDLEDEDYDEDVEDEDLEGDLEDDDFDDEPPAPRRRASRKAASPRTSTRRRTSGDGQPSKAPSSRGRTSTATRRAPVRRGR